MFTFGSNGFVQHIYNVLVRWSLLEFERYQLKFIFCMQQTYTCRLVA